MTRGSPTERLAGVATRHPKRMLLAWVGIVMAALVLSVALSTTPADDNGVTGSSESARASRLVQQRLRAEEPPREYVVVELTDVAAQGLDAAVAELAANLRALPEVESVLGESAGVATTVADGGRRALLEVTLAGKQADAQTNALPVIAAIEAADATDGLRVTTAGDGSIDAEFDRLAEETLMHGELIGVGVGLVILVVVFGAAVAAGVPLVLAIVSIIVAIGMTAVIGQVLELSSFVTNIITMIGLAVGIDYSLFIVQRMREERRAGRDQASAIVAAARTASRTVVFSGIAVVIALAGLMIMPDPMFQSFGLGAIVVVVAAVAAALSLLPAVLMLMGDRVNAGRLPSLGRKRSAGRLWDRLAHLVMARPVLSAALATAVLVGAGGFYLRADLGTNGISALPDGSGGRHAFEVVSEYFADGIVTTDIVVDADVQTPAVTRALTHLAATLAADPFYGAGELEMDDAGTLAVYRVGVRAEASSPEARAALRTLRTLHIPEAFAGVSARVLVTGNTAEVVDGVAETKHYMPIVMGFVLGLSFLLLLVAFRSIVVPLKAVILNLLSVGAAYGAIVLVFQEGVGASLLGFRQVPVIEFWLPLFLFSILFGLSMDYHVFLLSRIKERFNATGDNAASVGFGLSSTGSIITGAALIMVAVFGGFALGEMVMFQQMGFGLAVAVIVDATIVRCVLVPASMAVLGDWNWYLPSWLEWLPRLEIEHGTGPDDTARPPAPIAIGEAAPGA